MRPYAPERRRGRARSSNIAVSLHECEMTHTVLISIDDDRRSERTADDNEIPRRISKATKSSMGMYLSLSLSLEWYQFLLVTIRSNQIYISTAACHGDRQMGSGRRRRRERLQIWRRKIWERRSRWRHEDIDDEHDCTFRKRRRKVERRWRGRRHQCPRMQEAVTNLIMQVGI